MQTNTHRHGQKHYRPAFIFSNNNAACSSFVRHRPNGEPLQWSTALQTKDLMLLTALGNVFMCEVQGDAELSLAFHYLSSSAATSVSAVQNVRKNEANGRCEHGLSASSLPLLAEASHQDFWLCETSANGRPLAEQSGTHTDRITWRQFS